MRRKCGGYAMKVCDHARWRKIQHDLAVTQDTYAATGYARAGDASSRTPPTTCPWQVMCSIANLHRKRASCLGVRRHLSECPKKLDHDIQAGHELLSDPQGQIRCGLRLHGARAIEKHGHVVRASIFPTTSPASGCHIPQMVGESTGWLPKTRPSSLE